MKILLTAINAKFIHSSLAVRCLKSYARKYEENIEICEYTINNEESYILKDIYEKNPDVVSFSCYIWNIDMVKDIAQCIKKVLPKCRIICGGPEVSFDSEEFLAENEYIDMVLWGEGEKPFLSLVEYFMGERNVEEVYNLTYRGEKGICKNEMCVPASLDEVPFVYEDLSGFENKIIYYETQRGCPYNCQFCLSSVEKGVHFLSEERVMSDLQHFIDNRVKQVKFVDRTFNCNKKHAMNIWKYLMDHDNGVTNFHMEIEAHVLDDETIEFLKTAREGLFQFEIGI
ncbi:MAG: cobalamin-dependent protein, partial [Firmicutes bacterium]|nr:cobalamin-dependent protein [Bacillota bacterium]